MPKEQFETHEVICINSAGTHKIVYSDWGHSNPNIIVCIHGLTGNGHDFDYLAPTLVNRGYRVIAIDLAGRGRSDFLSDPMDYNYTQYHQDIMAVLDSLGLNKPNSIDWLGISLGGLLGISIAGMQDSPIKRMIINDVGPEIPEKSLKLIYYIIRKLFKFKDINALETRMRKTRGLSWGPITDEQWQYMARHNYRNLPPSLLSKRKQITYAYDNKIAVIFKKTPIGGHNLWDYWSNITCPVLVLRGGKSLILPVEILERMKDTATNFQMDTHEFADCGHVPSLMAPDQIKVVSDWLDKS